MIQFDYLFFKGVETTNQFMGVEQIDGHFLEGFCPFAPKTKGACFRLVSCSRPLSRWTAQTNLSKQTINMP